MIKKKIMLGLVCTVLVSSMLYGCGNSAENKTTEADSSVATESYVRVTQEIENTEATTEQGQVATADEMTDVIDVVEPGMEPVYANQLKDGVYSVTVDSSSSMFRIVSCELTVEDGKMTAVMTMSGTGYLYLYMGTGEEAVQAEETDWIPFAENEAGEHTFTVPVEALDEGISCTAFSKRKEKWYDRTILFRADSLSSDAYTDGQLVSVSDLELEDGEYEAEVTLEGGSGRASVESPALLTVKDGKCIATITWSSSNYDYMKVDGVQYDVIQTEGNSTFEIPVEYLDYKMPVIADTTAMSQPYEIDYTLFFDSATLTKR